MAVDGGYPRDRCEPNLALARAIGNEDNRFATRFLEEVKESLQANPCRQCVDYSIDPSERSAGRSASDIFVAVVRARISPSLAVLAGLF